MSAESSRAVAERTGVKRSGGGAAGWAAAKMLDGHLHMVFVMCSYLHVKRRETPIGCALAERRQLSESWTPVLTVPDDEALAHLAVEAKADYFVSHNIRHLSPARELGFKLLAPRGFPEIIRA